MSEELVGDVAIHGTEETGLDVECAWNVGKALAEWLPASGWVAVTCLAEDRRHIAEAAMEGLRLQGRDVLKINDQQIEVHRQSEDFAGAIIVGVDGKETTLELFDKDGVRIEGVNGLNAIRALVEAGNFVPAIKKGSIIAI